MTPREQELTRLCQECMGVMIAFYLTHPHPDAKQHGAVLDVERRMKAAGIEPIPARFKEKV